LDLHTHCYEATHIAIPTIEVVAKIVAVVKVRQLDGIAITEHNNKDYGYQVKEIVENHFNNEVLVIPGQEIEKRSVDIVELYLQGCGVFRFLAHPGYPYPVDFSHYIDGLQGIEIRNFMHNRQMNKDKIREIAEEYHLLQLANSDAHHLEDIGRYYNEIELDELCCRAR
jgi:hypothetical protein